MVVEDRDHQDRAQIIDDGQGEQERAQRDRELGAYDREHGQRESDVGRHRDTPAGEGVGIAEGRDSDDVENGGNRHARQSGNDRDDRPPELAEAARDELVLELEPRVEEKDREQPVGRPDLKCQVQAEGLGPQLDLGQFLVGRTPGGVGPHEREHGRAEQQRAADGLLTQRCKHPRVFTERESVEHDLALVLLTSAGSPWHPATLPHAQKPSTDRPVVPSAQGDDRTYPLIWDVLDWERGSVVGAVVLG